MSMLPFLHEDVYPVLRVFLVQLSLPLEVQGTFFAVPATWIFLLLQELLSKPVQWFCQPKPRESVALPHHNRRAKEYLIFNIFSFKYVEFETTHAKTFNLTQKV